MEIKQSNKKVYKHIFCPKGVKYEVKNSNGGLLGGTWNLEGAKQIAEKFTNKYKNDKLNSHLKVWIEELQGE